MSAIKRGTPCRVCSRPLIDTKVQKMVAGYWPHAGRRMCARCHAMYAPADGGRITPALRAQLPTRQRHGVRRLPSDTWPGRA